MHLSAIFEISDVFFKRVNRMDIVLEVKFACYITIMHSVW